MNPRSGRGLFSRLAAAGVSAALVFSASVPGSVALADEVHLAAPESGFAGARVVVAPLTDGLVPQLTLPGSPVAPLLAPPAVVSGGQRQSAAVESAVLAAPAAPITAEPAVEKEADAARDIAAQVDSNETSENAKSYGDAQFRRLTGEAPAPADAPPLAPRPFFENALGFRSVRGLSRNPALGRLPSDANASRIVDQIAGQFGLARAEVLSLAGAVGMDEASDRVRWLAVHDELQAANRDHFKKLDSQKYAGWSSFRELGNIQYAPGLRGAIERAFEVHKHSLGVAFRLPYHLFDMFLFGFFRQASAFEFFHAHEDFLGLQKDPELAKRRLEASLRRQPRSNPGTLARMRANAGFRGVERLFLIPLAVPLSLFLFRRVKLAIMSAVAMALLGTLAPALPMSFALTAIPLLGPALVGALHGIPVAVGLVPLFGHFLAPVAAAACGALAKDLVLGPVLNTLILSTLLTFPVQMKGALLNVRDRHPGASLSAGEWLSAFGGTFVSRAFWAANAKSFLGLATVGAEIEGILTYGAQIDAVVDPGFTATHTLRDNSPAGFHHAGIFEMIGSAIERPRGQSVIPFGGAITWGNSLLYKAEELVGVHFSAAAPAAPAAPARSEKEDLHKKAQDLMSRSRPITPVEKAEYDRLLKRLTAKSDQAYVEGKLAQRFDLAKGAQGAALGPKTVDDLHRLQALNNRFDKVLGGPPPDRRGPEHALAAKAAGAQALAARLREALTPGAGAAAAAPLHARLSPDKIQQIEDLVDAIVKQRAKVKGDLAQRDATQQLLQAANKIRNHALSERRNGQGEQRLHADFAKLDTVVDLALSLNEISAAQAAIAKMQGVLAQNTAAINAANAQNQQNLANTNAAAAGQSQWQQQAQQTVNGDVASQASLKNLQTEASTAVQDIGAFQTAVSNFIAQVNAQDKGSSANAAAEYARRLALLPQAAQWAKTGNPNDSSAFSLSSFQADLAEIQGALSTAQTGLPKLQTVPVELAGVLVIAVPGSAPGEPNPTVTNPTKADDLDILAKRLAGWQAEQAKFQQYATQVDQMMDPNYTGTTTNVFGDVEPVSLPRWLAQTQNDLNVKQAAAKTYLSELDQTAARINAATGSNIPMLSSLSLNDLQTAIQNYAGALEAVKFPSDGTVATFQAKMSLITAAQNVPLAARAIIEWSKDQDTATQIQSAITNTLPTVQTSLHGLVQMGNAILADVQADLNFVNTAQGGGQALIDRKTALLQSAIIPALQSAQTMLTEKLIPYQQSSIASYASNSSGSYYTLYTAQQTLLTQTNSLYNTTIPWAIVAQGAPTGDTAAALSDIAAYKQTYLNYLNGYTDSAGPEEGVIQYQQDMRDRQCTSGCTRTENVYGVTQPYSLPLKISQYGAETAQYASKINIEDAQLNAILNKIQTLSNGRYNLQSYLLPTGIGTDAASVAKVTAAKNLVLNLATELSSIANAEKSSGGATTISVGAGGSATVPVGKQPSPTIGINQEVAILALNAAQRLVPSSVDQPGGAPAAYAIAQYLYSNSIVAAAQNALTTEVPQAAEFLKVARKSLDDAVADTQLDVAYVNSNGTDATPAQIYARKIAIFNELNSFLAQGVSFYALKQGWDQQAFETINSVNTYDSALASIYSNGSTVNQNELSEMNSFSSALAATAASLQQTQAKVVSWMSQLDPKQQSALRNVSDDFSHLQDQTRAVVEANIRWHQVENDFKRLEDAAAADVTQTDALQKQLAQRLDDPDAQYSLDPALVAKIASLRLGGSRGSWAIGGEGDATQAIVVKKSDFSSFTDALLGMLTHNAQNLADQDLASLKQSLLANPQGISRFIPGASIMQFGDSADGFYLVYQTNFSVPNGLNTGTSATLGNIGKVWGNNVSLNAYALTSPPSSGGQNAPYGDKGVEVQVESLQGESWVNYLNVDLHRFGFDIPVDNSLGSTLSPSRLMVFDDYAVMLLNNKLYVGLAGYADAALSHPGQNESFEGGNVKTSLKLNSVMTLDASQQELFIKDPRQFLEDINLNFTGYDTNLGGNVPITATGDKKYLSRTQAGPTFDVNRLLNPNGGGDSFTVSLFTADTRGTDDIQQKTLGTTVVKGFSIKNDQGKTWLQINNNATGELGQKANTLSDRLSFTLPDKGITLSAQGQLIGGASDHYAQLSKKMSDNTAVALGYGSEYIGEKDRLQIALNTSFSLAQLWQAVADHSARDLKGARTLDKFNKDLGSVFGADAKDRSETVQALSRVFEADVARKLITQNVGTLTSDIQELRKAGAFLDNTRTRAMVGFTSGAVDNTTADLAVGGGPEVGTYTQMTLTKTQKKLIEDKSASLYREGLRLQDELINATKRWQSDVAELAEAQWEQRLANEEMRGAPNESMRADARVRLSEADDRFHQALLDYNALAGRGGDAASPFAELNAADLHQLMRNIRDVVAAPDRFKTILGELDPKELQKTLGDTPFNLMDWLPWVDRFTAGFGVQYQDMLNNQVLTVGVGFRLPIYDPSSKAADKAYVLETRAVDQEIQQVYAERDVQRRSDEIHAQAWRAAEDAVAPKGPAAERALDEAVRGYRNGAVGIDGLRRAFDDWRWYAQTALEASANASLAAAAAAIEDPSSSGAARLPREPATISSFDDAFALAQRGSHGLAEIAARSQAADAMARSQEHRLQKAWLSINAGIGLTDSGLGFLPSLAITGIPVTPVLGFDFKPEELRELQVVQHDRQKAYYDDLLKTTKIGLAIQFYQQVVVERSARESLALDDARVLPALESAAAAGDAGAARRLDEARVKRQAAAAAEGQALAQMNFLLGRAADAPLEIRIDPAQALASLQALVAAERPVETQKRLLDARVAVDRAVEEMVDKNLKVQVVQVEPVSIIMRAFSRLVGAVGGGTVYDPDKAAAARASTVKDERARDAYDGRRADRALGLRQRLAAAEKALSGLHPESAPADAVAANELKGEMLNLRAGLLALDDASAGPAAAASADAPRSWAELQARLRASEQALASRPSGEAPEIPSPDSNISNSAAYARFDQAKQTLGEVPIDKNFAEGWIEVRLRDANTPIDVQLSLARLRDEKETRIYKTQLAGATAEADVLTAQFQADVRLQRWLAARPDSNAFHARIDELGGRVQAEAERIAALLGSGVSAAQLVALVPEDAARASGAGDLAATLIDAIRDRELDNVRATLFSDGGLPDSFGSEDGLMQQINANTLSERMSYKGFTPVLATGLFQGARVSGAFLEAPDPRDIQRGLENIMSDVLRKQMESDGRIQQLSLRLNQLITRVQDGVKELEARRRQIDAAEADLRARTALASTPDGVAALGNSSVRLARAWSDFGRTMVVTKSSFIELVSELEALGQGAAASLHPLRAPVHAAAASSLRPDTRGALIDFWTERLADPAFETAADGALSGESPAVPAELRAQLRADADAYRAALRDSAAARENGGDEAERLERLARNDPEGKRLRVRADVADAVDALGGVEAASDAGKKFIAFMRVQAEKAAAAQRATLAGRRAVMRGLSQSFWGGATPPPPAAAAAFARLEVLQKKLDSSKDLLMAEYLSDRGDKPIDFLLTDRLLDDELKAEKSFDDELMRTLESADFQKNPALARALDGLYDLRRELLDPNSRAAERARYGRGIDALNAMIDLERARLDGARSGARPPDEIEGDAQSLQNLVDMKERWRGGAAPELTTAIAVVAVGAGDVRTWNVREWITPDRRKSWLESGAIERRNGREYVDGGKFELIGGLDLAAAERQDALEQLSDNARANALYAAMAGSDFVLTNDAVDSSPAPLALDEVYGRHADGRGLAESGALFYFKTPDATDPTEPQAALAPLVAQQLPPDQVVVMAYRGPGPIPGGDAFPTLQSLRRSAEAADFQRLVLTPRGADALARLRRADAAADLRRGWVETKLNSFGFARDADGRMVQLYATPAEFEAAAKAFDKGARSKSWTLYRSGDLALGLDASGAVVRVSAPPARGALALDATIGDAPAATTLSGPLAAAVLDERGEIVKSYRTDAEVDAAAPSWSLVSYSAQGDGAEVRAKNGALQSTKVRFSHYEEGGRPVLLSQRYLISRVDKATSQLKSAGHWALMPYNWGNIALEIPRGVAQAPLEVITGRNPEDQHFLGRVAMHKSDGGETDHHGFFRTALGWVDVLDLLPDPVEPFFDPSQYPDAVRASTLRPGEDLAEKKMIDPANGREVHFGAGALARKKQQASEDFAAARARTLARFNGGVEEVTLASLRGRGRADYLESRVNVRSGDAPDIAANPDASGGVRTTATPGELLADRVTRRVTVYPGAVGEERRAAALDGYAERVEIRAEAAREAAVGLNMDRKKAEDALWSREQELAQRIAEQRDIERRLAAIQARLAGK